MLDLVHVSKTFNPGTVNEKKALDDVTLHLEKGDFVTLIGSNGAGKSTLMAAVAGEFTRMQAAFRWMGAMSPLCRTTGARGR